METPISEVHDFGAPEARSVFDEPVHYEPYEFEKEDAWQDDAASSVHHSSGPEADDEQVFDLPSPQSSPRTSRSPSDGSDDEVMVSGKTISNPHTPCKRRSPFRNPSSVRAMQTEITPPQLSRPSTQRKHHFLSPSRRGTPRTPSKMSTGKKVKKEYPLILLHITLLPLTHQYSPEILEATLPPTILANWKLLREKHAQTVLDRGVLIPHPREDYGLLEERLLESLELKIPRILKCGHFHLSPEEQAEIEGHESDEESDAEDADMCRDCGRRVRDGRLGDAGTGSKRWDIKIYAANGLMRAGAWSAAWKEMERIDAEITPWMEDDMKRELELRWEEEQRHRAEQERSLAEDGVGNLDDERLREIYGQNPPIFNTLPEEHPTEDHTQAREWSAPAKDQYHELSLSELVTRVVYKSAQDRRNVAIFFLSIFILFLSVQMSMRNPQPANIVLTTPTPNAVAHPDMESKPAPVHMPQDLGLDRKVEQPASVEEVKNENAGEETSDDGPDVDQIVQEMLSE